LPSDPSSNLILSTKAGSTIPPDGPMPQPELLKKKKKRKLLEINSLRIKRKQKKTRIDVQRIS
jgi:hypothetical protein